MNRTQLVQAVTEATDLPHPTAGLAVDALLEAVVAAVAAGDRVVLPGFGTFEPRERAARTGRNPQTGEPLEIPAGTLPAFKAGSAFKQRVAGA